MVLNCHKYKKQVMELKQAGYKHVTEILGYDELFGLRKFVMVSLDTLSETLTEDETIISNEPVIVAECMSYTIHGAFEGFRENVIADMISYDKVDVGAKVYISDMLETPHSEVKLVVASVKTKDDAKIIQEYYIMPYSLYNVISKSTVVRDLK